MAAGGKRQLQIWCNLSVSAAPSQLPWEGSLGGALFDGEFRVQCIV